MKKRTAKDPQMAAANDKTVNPGLNEDLKKGVETVMKNIKERKKKLPNIVETTERRTVSVEYGLTADQTKKIARDLAQLQIEIVEMEDEKKTVMKGFSERMAAKKTSIGKFSRQIRDGYDHRDHTCVLVLDFKKKEKRYKDIESKKIVKVETFSPGDEQLRFL